MPNSRFKALWNLIMILLLLYTATYVPYKTAFIDETSRGLFYFEILVDGLFFLDVIINFISAYERSDTTIEKNGVVIVKSYLKTWFFLDLVACIPFQLMEVSSGESDSGKYNKLLRLARLPRLYRLLRILRLFKMVRLLRYNAIIKKLLDEMKMNAGIMRMISVTMAVFFLVHLMSCFWFMSVSENT